MNLQDAFAPPNVRTIDHHATVKAAGPEERRVQHVGTVGRRDQDDAFVRFEAVHLHQQLIKCLFALIVTAAQSRAAVASHCIDFVDKNDARRIFLALFKQVANTAGADAHKHFHKIGAGDGKERNVRLARDRPRQQGLTRARRPDQQHAFREYGRQASETSAARAGTR